MLVIYIISLKEVKKSNWLRLILVNSQIFNFLWLLCQLLPKQLKILFIIIININIFSYKEECRILN